VEVALSRKFVYFEQDARLSADNGFRNEEFYNRMARKMHPYPRNLRIIGCHDNSFLKQRTKLRTKAHFVSSPNIFTVIK
jgi:hypothetical protein